MRVGAIAANRRRGGGGGNSLPTIAAPVLTKTSGAGISPFTFDETLPTNVDAGYRRRIQSADDNLFTAIVQDLYTLVTEAELAGDQRNWSDTTGVNPPRQYADNMINGLVLNWTGTRNLRMRYELDIDATTTIVSAWSNIIADTFTNVMFSAAAGDHNSAINLTSGNMVATSTDDTILALVRANIAQTAGKPQIEFQVGANPGEQRFGVEDGATVFGPATASSPGDVGDTHGVCFINGSWGYEIHYNGVVLSDYASATKAIAGGDVISIVPDFTPAIGARTISFYRTRAGVNGGLPVLLGTVTGLGFTTLKPFCGNSAGSPSIAPITINAGPAFARALGAGETAW